MWRSLLLLVLSAISVKADTYGDWKYSVKNGEATITQYTGSGGKVVIPNMVSGFPVKTIGSGYPPIFGEENKLVTSIIIPSSVTRIECGTFQNCINLTNAIISRNVTSIEPGTFNGCTSLTQIIIPNSVTSIGTGAFSGCISLSQITIPNSVISIGMLAFGGCTSLTNITIPNSVISIENDVFNGCTSLSNITLSNSVRSINDWAFEDCHSLKEISVASDNPFFTSHEGILYDKDKTTLIWCPQGRTGKITIPSSVTSIKHTFEGCTNLTDIFVDSANPVYSSVDGVLYVNAFDCKSKILVVVAACPKSRSGAISITNSVTGIDNSAFKDCVKLTNITIPESVKDIGNSAFEGCVGITNITIPGGVTRIGKGAFSYCKSLSSITIPASVVRVEDSAFDGCTRLTNISVALANPNYYSLDGVLYDQNKGTLITFPEGKSGAKSFHFK